MKTNASILELENLSKVINRPGVSDRSCIDQLEGILAYKTVDHEIVHCNNNFLKYIGYKSVTELEGKTDHDLIWHQYTDIYHNQEDDALDDKVYYALHPGTDVDGRDFLFFNRKYPWFDEKNRMRGIISYSIEISDSSLIQIGKLLKKTAVHNPTGVHFVGKPSAMPHLSKREKQCLFYLIRGKTAKSIGEILHISYRTVECYINGLKDKLNCRTRSELIDFAINVNFVQIIPGDIFPDELINSLSD